MPATTTAPDTRVRTSIRIEGLTKSYPPQGSVGSVTAVDNVTLTIGAGELFFLLGPSGCGKTTLLRMIAGFIEPTAGKIVFCSGSNEVDVTHTEPNRRNTGMVFQSYALWPHLSVAANVGFGLDVRKVGGREKADRVRRALEVVQMEKYADRKPVQLSGGQQQRVALARAIVINPAVLLLDEPLSNLDAKLRLELRLEIRRVCKELGMTAIYVTHDQKEALSMADRMAVLRAGRIEAVGTPRELYHAPRTRFVAEFLGETNFVAAAPSSDAHTFDTPLGTLRTSIAAPGPRCLLSLRPEALTLCSHADHGIECHVKQVVFLGDTAQVVVDAPGNTTLKLSTLHPMQIPNVGDRVRVRFSPDAVVPVLDV